jgi:hypothetical protein
VSSSRPVNRHPIRPDRIRTTRGGFAYIPNRFLHGGYLATLDAHELSLYVFLVLAGDRHGVSYYGHESICSTLGITREAYLDSRNALIAKDLIAFDGKRFQVLSLPKEPVVRCPPPLLTSEDLETHDPATVRQLIAEHFGRRR